MGWHGPFTIKNKFLPLLQLSNRMSDNKIFFIKKLIFLLLIFSAGLIYSDNYPSYPKNDLCNYVSFDLDAIRNRGKLIAITDYNSTNYFIYKGEPMGFHYELLKSFSDQIGVSIEIITDNNQEYASDMLKTGKADLIAIGIDSTLYRGEDIRLTEPIDETRLVLVQRKPPDWRLSSGMGIDLKLIRNPKELINKKVYMQAGSSDIERVRAFKEEIGDSVSIIEVPYEPEKLIQNVAQGEIEYAICNENVASVNATYYPDIDVGTPLGLPRGLSWGVRRNNSDSLLCELNRWITTFRRTESYSLLYSKYFKNSRSSRIVKSNYYASNTGKISKYDDLIRKFSENIKWDWRLLASLIYQESRFEANVISQAGAYGLMQIMPVTGRNFGIDVTSSPENNLKVGILFIKWLDAVFNTKIYDKDERLNFILASYNAGPGHVFDAMKLAEKNGMDSSKWDGNVALWLLKMADPLYYKDNVVKNGYFRGVESVRFVSEVRNRFEQYKNIIPLKNVAPFNND
jgi:membrane-bound lytic murein transglycosylase F